MKKIIIIISFLFSVNTAFSQSDSIDIMLQKISAEKDDNMRFDIIYLSLASIGESNPLLGLKYAHKLLEYSQNNNDKIGEAYAMSFMGKMYGVSAISKKAWDML